MELFMNGGVCMKDTELIKQWEAEENFAFQGWDFSHIDGRWNEPTPPRNYKDAVKSNLKETDILLDMGTGGGEVLLSLNHPYIKTYVTEAYEPNYELCKRVLAPLGITVARTYTDENFNSDDTIPYNDNLFDVVINRHESFDLDEVDRVLKRGGHFITQQVGNKNTREFLKMLNDDFMFDLPLHTIENYTATLTELGFNIIKADEAEYPVKVYDVGALVYVAKIITWEYPNFSVKTHLDKLLGCQRKIDEEGFLLGMGHSFIIVAQKS
jgi:SAM-dependent methyltransferase